MIKASLNDKGLVISILSQAFANEKSVNYMIKQDEIKDIRICSLIDYSFEVCNLFGGVWLSDDRKACALILYPHKMKSGFKSILLDLKFISRAVGFGSITKMLKWSAMIKKIMPKEKLIYLWFIGVDPLAQQKGTGSSLLTQIIKWSETENLPICLETSTLETLPWFKKFNFKIYDNRDIYNKDKGYPLFFLKRKRYVNDPIFSGF